jgi:hypothetical protein
MIQEVNPELMLSLLRRIIRFIRSPTNLIKNLQLLVTQTIAIIWMIWGPSLEQLLVCVPHPVRATLNHSFPCLLEIVPARSSSRQALTLQALPKYLCHGPVFVDLLKLMNPFSKTHPPMENL